MKADLCQHMTPLWVAEALVERFFPGLSQSDLVIEPSCGVGSFLEAIPSHVPAIGVDIDRDMCDAAMRTGRHIIHGDFRSVELDVTATAIIGNPPFRADVFDGFLERAHRLLPYGGRAGFILPNYFFQTASRVCRYADHWSIEQQMLPRHAFHVRMRTPLIFAVFSKDRHRALIGFALYREHADTQQMRSPYRELLTMTQGSVWRAVCRTALRRLGGEATLPDIYAEIESHRANRTKFWREKIRQTLRVYPDDFRPIGTGRFALRRQEAA